MASILEFVVDRAASRGVHSTVFFQAIVHALPQSIDRPGRPGYANDRHIEMSTPNHRLQRRKDFLESQITCHSVENQGVRVITTHGNAPVSDYYSWECFSRAA